MQLQIKSPKIWVACSPVDFRKAIDGLSEIIATRFGQSLEGHLYIFHNRAKDKIKLLAYHRTGALLIYKRLDKGKFTLSQNDDGLFEITEQQLSWLVAGLDWIDMTTFSELSYDDYF